MVVVESKRYAFASCGDKRYHKYDFGAGLLKMALVDLFMKRLWQYMS